MKKYVFALALFSILFIASCTQIPVEDLLREKYNAIETIHLEASVYSDSSFSSNVRSVDLKFLMKKPNKYVRVFTGDRFKEVNICNDGITYHKSIGSFSLDRISYFNKSANCSSLFYDIEAPIETLRLHLNNDAKVEESVMNGTTFYTLRGTLTPLEDGMLSSYETAEDEFVISKDNFDLISWTRKLEVGAHTTQIMLQSPTTTLPKNITSIMKISTIKVNIPIDDSEFSSSKLEDYNVTI